MSDLTNLAVSIEATNAVNWFVDRGYFKEQTDVLNYAAAYMIKHHFEDFSPLTYTPTDSKGSNHHVATLDPTGKIKNLITILYPEAIDTPYQYLRALMDGGVLQLKRDIESNPDLSIFDEIE